MIGISESRMRMIIRESMGEVLSEVNNRSARRDTVLKDPAFDEELYNRAVEEAKREYEEYVVEEMEGWYGFIPKKWDSVISFERWLGRMGGKNYIRSLVKQYKRALFADKLSDERFCTDDELSALRNAYGSTRL